ncbi:PDZ domain-containing protein [Citricoccus sp. SGAir0253]|uniref:S1C family serine protease n=1 Tax=Citricoccus sp. SGAir0253 TaxID=2567881 RepID=UPI0010CCEDC2|nr:trypsin-like peptidase domain-containing protein [Citricoccus sp. SGAir0253]QCU77735.1 PDZ domain-containing protein [Citricoccus sp. SGAir0253]
MNDAEQHGPQPGEGRQDGGPVPPRPRTPPPSSSHPAPGESSVSAARDPHPRWGDTQALPRMEDGGAPGRGAAPAADRAAGPAGQPGWGATQGAAGAGPATPDRTRPGTGRRTVGVGTLVAGMLLAGLAGGGVAAGVNAAVDDDAPAAARQDAGTVQQQGHGLDINRSEDATPVTAAAAKAAPSVVTLSVSDGQAAGSGSGVILDDQGHILTNTHVVTLGGQSGSTDITVQTADGNVHTATMVGIDPESDLAVVKIDAPGLTPIELGRSADLNVGDTAIAIGAPLGLSGTVTDGIVSKLNRTISVSSSAPPEAGGDGGSGDAPQFRIPGVPQQQQSRGSIYINVIQTDAAINPGNSGGALIDAQGRLIGINVAIASAAGGSSGGEAGNIGVGFSIPVDHAQRVAQDLIENGEATHGFLGVQVTPQPATPEGAEGAPAPGAGGAQQGTASGGFSAGARVVEVVPGSPADEAGLRTGDVITGVGDRPVTDSQSLTAVVREYPEGGTATVHFTRDGKDESAEVTFTGGQDQQ